MANITKRGDKQYRVRIRRDGHPSLSKTFDTKTEAAAWAGRVEADIRRGSSVDLAAQRTTFREVATRYQDEVTPQKRSAKSEIYRLTLLINEFGDYFVNNIRPLEIAKFRDKRLETVAAQTVIHDLNTLSAVIQHARREWGIQLAENPVSLVRKPKRAQGRDRRVTPTELAYLLQAAADQAAGLAPVIELALETSCRLGELLSLTWAGVNLKSKTLQLEQTKNGDRRTVALSKRAVEVLAALPRRIDGRVFHWAGADSFEKTWRRCVERAKGLYLEEVPSRKRSATFLEDLRFHDLRHEATSRLFERGLNAFEVASMTGHKSMQMLRRYTHVEAIALAKKLG